MGNLFLPEAKENTPQLRGAAANNSAGIAFYVIRYQRIQNARLAAPFGGRIMMMMTMRVMEVLYVIMSLFCPFMVSTGQECSEILTHFFSLPFEFLVGGQNFAENILTFVLTLGCIEFQIHTRKVKTTAK